MLKALTLLLPKLVLITIPKVTPHSSTSTTSFSIIQNQKQPLLPISLSLSITSVFLEVYEELLPLLTFNTTKPNMAMSSSSFSDSPNSTESLNGLTIGHKIYFEDVGSIVNGGNIPKSTTTARAKSGANEASPTKKMKGVLQQQSSRCQVEGCNVDLSDVKAYYSRHKVCIMHSKSTVVVVGGVQKRFCQQCSRFHQLPEFDQEKRSCRRRLAGHNERRRKPPPMSFLTSHYGSSSVFDTNNHGRGFVLDFSKSSGNIEQHANSSDRRFVLETQDTGKFLMHPWPHSYENTPSGNYFHNVGGGTNFPSQEIPPGEYYTDGVSSDSNRALSLLSNEPWGSSKNQATYTSLINPHHNSTAAVTNHIIPSGSWGYYNGNESAGSESELVQIPQHVANVYSNEHGGGLQDGRQDIRTELNSRFYESVQQMHWSL